MVDERPSQQNEPGDKPSPNSAPTASVGSSSAGVGAGASQRNPPPPSAVAVRLASLRPGEEVGRYRLVEPLGAGGYGVVWLGERTTDYFERVAVKFIGCVLEGGEVSKAELASRFKLERQALATLGRHPNVARILDGGMHESFGPYIVMEHVDGVPITQFCEDARLGVRARLELVVQVCRAAAHAHAKEILHRDIKPSNVLVTRLEGLGPIAKLIDFGVAAWIARDGRAEDGGEDGLVLGTFDYMSPEQVMRGGHAADARSDVYALGALMYRLVTGRVPLVIPRDESGRVNLRAAQRVICEQGVEPPTTAIERISSRDAEALRALEQRLGTAVPSLLAQLREGLEALILDALAKDPKDRVQSAAELCERLLIELQRPVRGIGSSPAGSADERFHSHSAGVSPTGDSDHESDSEDAGSEAGRTGRQVGPVGRSASRAGGGSGGGTNPPSRGGFHESFGPGDRFGPYQLIELLTADAFQETWRAERTGRVSQIVAIVLVPAHLRRTNDRMFWRAAELQARCNHPSVTRLLDHGTSSDGIDYVVMEFHGGRPITEVSDGRALPLHARFKLLARVAEALHSVHVSGVIHRDIKPHKLAVVDDGFGELFVKLDGFDVSQPVGRDPILDRGSVLGTPKYMSPEQAVGEWDRVDSRSDVYSLGCVAYELLSGCSLRELGSVLDYSEFQRSIRQNVVVPPSNRLHALVKSDGAEAIRLAALRQATPQQLAQMLRQEVDPIVLRATQTRREDRFTSAIDMARALREAADRLTRPRRRWWWS